MIGPVPQPVPSRRPRTMKKEKCDEVELVFTVTAKGTGGAASADFAHRGFTGQGHHRVKQVTLPEPFGSRRVLGFAEPDGGWLGPMAD